MRGANLLKNQELWMSHIRSALKVGGAVAVAFGVAEVDQIEPLIAAVITASGAVMTAIGIFMSIWDHTPDAAPEAPKQ